MSTTDDIPEPAEEDTPEQSGEAAPTRLEDLGTPEGRAMIELLWNPPEPSGRGRRGALRLEGIVEAAIELARREGHEAVSMRKLAGELGVGTMSLYTYVPGRDELFELMVDHAYGDRDVADPTLPWRAQLEFHADEAWRMYQRHPWLVWSNLWRIPLGPQVMRVEEDMYRAVMLLGLTPVRTSRVVSLVESYAFGAARTAIVDTRQSAHTGMSSDDYWASRSSFWLTYYSAERYPAMTELWSRGAFDAPAGDWDEYRFGLGVLLDGIAALPKEPAGPEHESSGRPAAPDAG